VIEIRPASSDDDEALVAIDDRTWSPASSPAVHEVLTTFFGERADPADTVVAELGGAVVGYATLRQATTLPAHRHVVEINGVAVHPDAAGRGVGRALVEAAFAEAIRRGARKVSLRVLGTNAVARRLYARCGFVEEGVLRDEFLLEGRYVDDVLMARYAADSTPSRQSTMGSAQSGQGTS
jgi:ribosomal protein S18 acetylase RimI-like enzyme